MMAESLLPRLLEHDRLVALRPDGYDFHRHACERLHAREVIPSGRRQIIKDTVLKYRDDEVYQDVIDQEMAYKANLEYIADNWKTLIPDGE